MDKLGRLMSPELPQIIEPLRLAQANEQISGQYKLHAMKRLAALLYEDSGIVSFGLKFTRDEDNMLYCILGHVEAKLITTCQRCLEGLELDVKNAVKLGIANCKEDADKIPSGYDSLLVIDTPVLLQELIEDELLLAVPNFAMHDEDTCPAAELTKKLKTNDGNKPFTELLKIKQKINK